MNRPGPLVVDLQPGRHAICRCGATKTPPFCDGTHRGSGLAPEIVEVGEPSSFAWCTCRTSARLPRCDGSHRRLAPPD